MFRFGSPEYLYLLILLPLMALIYVYSYYKRRKNIRAFGDKELVKQLMPESSALRRHIKFSIILFTAAMFALLLARPQFGSRIEEVKTKGIEVMIALDISNSMLVKDIAPSRLERAKLAISKIIEKLEDNKIGLVVFAGDAYTQVPMTKDFISVKMFLESVHPNLIYNQGTNISEAINMAARSFGSNDDVSKSLILMTDGESHEGKVSEAISNAKKRNIHFSVIGIGTPGGGPLIDANTGDFRKDDNGNVIVSKLNEDMCKDIAEEGKGIYVRLDNTDSAIKAISSEIDKLTKSEIDAKVYTDFDEQFQYVAFIIFLLLMAEMAVLNRTNPFFRNINMFSKQ